LIIVQSGYALEQFGIFNRSPLIPAFLFRSFLTAKIAKKKNAKDTKKKKTTKKEPKIKPLDNY